MNAERLLALYDQVADAPDAIARLRRFVLDLAVRGKLVEQDLSDESALSLPEQIHEARQAYYTERAVRNIKPFAAASSAEVPFIVPSSWALVRLGEAMHLINGRAFNPTEWTESGLPIVRIQNLNNPGAVMNRFSGEVKEQHMIGDGDFLISWSGTPGTSFGAHIWNRGPALLNQHIFKAAPFGSTFVKDFLRLAINSRLLELIEKAHGGVGLQHITKPKLEAVVLTLPPLAEQHRIVARVDELMVTLNQLEAARTARENTRDRLAAASLARLTAPDTAPEAFSGHARFAIHNLPALTSRVEQVKQLRQTILSLAMQGKLVEIDDSDQPASALIDDVFRYRRTRIANAPVTPNRSAISWSVPSHWLWSSLDALIVFGPQNGVSPKESKDTSDPMSLTLTATTSGAFDGRHYKHVKLHSQKAEQFWLEPYDLLFQRGNTREYVGIAAIYDGLERHFVFPDLMMRVKVSPLLDHRYVHLWCISPVIRSYFQSKASGAQATMPKINQSVLRETPIALPPIREQRRIVAKVDQLMALCDRLEAALTDADTGRQRLLESLLREALHDPGTSMEAA